jgi:hypothetical protein
MRSSSLPEICLQVSPLILALCKHGMLQIYLFLTYEQTSRIALVNAASDHVQDALLMQSYSGASRRQSSQQASDRQIEC